MNLPIDVKGIDVKELISTALDIEKARKTPVSVMILIDESANPEFQVFVRAGFNSEAVNSRVMVSYFPTQTPDTQAQVDIAVIAAGTNPEVGAIAAALRENGTPTLVVAENGPEVMHIASNNQHAIPQEDLLCPIEGNHFDESMKDELGGKIGHWIVKACPENKLAFSIAYPFVRKPLALDAVNVTAAQNAGIGVVVFVPGADMPVMTANQAKMVLQIAAAYGQPLSADRIKELAGVLGSAFLFRSISRQVAGLVPALGWVVKGAMGYAGTVAIGRATIDYFENGGDLTGLAAVVGDTRRTLIEKAAFVKGLPAYKVTAEKVGPKARLVAGKALDATAPLVQSAAKTVWKAAKPGSKKKKSK